MLTTRERMIADSFLRFLEKCCVEHKTIHKPHPPTHLRNIDITNRVLNGETLTKVATDYGICAQRVRSIVEKQCRRVNKDKYTQLRCPSLDVLRQHKEYFLHVIHI